MIAIVDYQMGNLRSVQKAFQAVGISATIVSDPDAIRTAERLVLPGVGAFGDAMREITSRHFDDAIRDYLSTGRPFLGICLGLQLLLDRSQEGGSCAGLGIIPGEVRRFEISPPLKVPHMGWNSVRVQRPTPLLNGIPDGSFFYFVHSYFVVPDDAAWTVLETDYGQPFCSMICREQIVATQFHPEKSQRVGLSFLRNFATG